jgi:hypothetical protein
LKGFCKDRLLGSKGKFETEGETVVAVARWLKRNREHESLVLSRIQRGRTERAKIVKNICGRWVV